MNDIFTWSTSLSLATATEETRHVKKRILREQVDVAFNDRNDKKDINLETKVEESIVG